MAKFFNRIFLCVFASICFVSPNLEASISDFFFNNEVPNIDKPVYKDYVRYHAPRPTEVQNWPSARMPHLGQISGVSVNTDGQPVIFHRGPRLFNVRSFNATYDFQMMNEGPIDVDTVLTLDPMTGGIINSWGAGLFYLPHGITVDRDGNTWLTDIAMHQVFKFPPGSSRPSLTFGEKFQPGNDIGQLCMPTSTAVAYSGEIFIADGYCNSRVLKFNNRGAFLRSYPSEMEFLNLQIPHSLTLLEKYDLLCIADRENMRVICVNSYLHGRESAGNINSLNIQEPDFGRVFAIASYGDYIYAVNGPTSPMISIQGFTIQPLAEAIVDHWDSFADKMWMPHDIAISPDGTDLYIASVSPNRIVKFSMKPPYP